MRRSRRKQINKEIASIASLEESAIDLSDVPELKGWSQAIIGRFHRPHAAGALHMGSRVETVGQRRRPASETRNPSTNQGQSVAPGALPTGDNRFREMNNGLLVEECIRGVNDALIEFVRRWHRFIETSIVRSLRGQQLVSTDVDDLVQDVYLKLVANGCKALKGLQSYNDSAFFGFLKTISANVVQDRLPSANSMRGRAGIPLNAPAVDPHDRRDSIELEVLAGEIDRILRRIASPRDAQIFWLFYGQGLTAKQIAEVQEGLKEKGVESTLRRLRRAISQELVLPPKGQRQAEVAIAPTIPIQIGPGKREELTRKSVEDLLLAIKQQLARDPKEHGQAEVKLGSVRRTITDRSGSVLDELLRDIRRTH